MTQHANDHQVGGTHYKSEYQHWDFVARHKLGYFEGQISRYLTRHSRKKGFEDALKGLHFAEKLLEVYLEGYHSSSNSVAVDERDLGRYSLANELTTKESLVMAYCMSWYGPRDLRGLISAINEVILEVYGSDAVAAYVNQGKY